MTATTEMSSSASPSGIRSLSIDRQSGSYSIRLDDGRSATTPAESLPFDSTSALSRLEYSAADSTLTATTGTGDIVVFDLPSSPDDRTPPIRPVVYFDQNHWSAVSNSIHSPERVRQTRELEAANSIVGQGLDRLITLPASSGHYYETTRWTDDERRYNLGLTILQLSRGWIMRAPLQVRRDEIRTLLPTRYPPTSPRPVITKLPVALNGLPDGSDRDVPARPGMQAQMSFITDYLVLACAHIDTMLDRQPVEAGQDVGWAQANQEFTRRLRDFSGGVEQRRRMIDAWFLSDLRHDIVEEGASLGVTPGDFGNWWPGAATALGTLPSVGIYRQMVHERHLSPGTTWRLNDLTDMVYLSCAAGYADVVVCERHMAHIAQRAVNRAGNHAAPVITHSLSDAVKKIKDWRNSHS